ncbi:hypothetical protein ASG29_13690 [Sphingomonas sp. Leaf412]|uniref:MarR family winged helix-turn-helix transcriptional regulator n=1 Tax=Sphingomonas sp. Leaf412 TaxID=1736370 RepID=UPI0006F7105F|nr:MarR family winged helix-turn-helix transcriptional regulator [Sphingomonas sp. Leaf412]KQT32753.1 hypothetical protein ASG29_13690 [Sphingomonas sp. Leaf412]
MPFYAETNFYPESSIGYLLRVGHQHGVAALDRLFAAEGISAVQWSALISIHFGRGATCATLARDLAHDKGAMTRMIDALEAKGLVMRRRDSDDRRVINLSLTTEGEAMAMRCRKLAIACWNHLLDDWDAAEVDALIAQLNRLRATMEAKSCAA